MNTRLSSLLRLSSVAAILAIVLGTTAWAQIEVAPTRVLLTMRERSQEVNVSNPSDNPVEVNTELGYRLIRTDSLGSVTLDSARSSEELAHSGKGWLKIFPRRFTLAPRSSRLVRVMVTIPDGVEDGEYWSRLVVTGTPVNSSIKVDMDSAQGIETNLKMRMELDLPVIIRKGEVTTGVMLEGAQARRDGDGTLLLVDMTRTGNSAYRGTLVASLRDAAGTEVAHAEEQFTTEFSIRRAIRLPHLADGDYTLRLESRSVKRGGANDAVIPAPTVSRTYQLRQTSSGIAITPSE